MTTKAPKFSKALFRCSKLGLLMTNSRSKSETLSKTTQTYLREYYIEKVYGRKKDFVTKYTAKGLLQEEDAITLLSLHLKKMLVKNESNYQNPHISGTPDIINNSIVYDVKSSWDIFTYFNSITSALIKDYYWQMQGYMALTHCNTSFIAFCLVNTPTHLIEAEKRKVNYHYDLLQKDITIDNLTSAFAEVDKSCIYDDIPNDKKIFLVKVLKNDDDIKSLYKRIIDCRIFLMNLSEL
ncbi:MAG: hypothetical protein H8D45_08015 [Bacteroidetes bacterium]|nr:hypothetical protein [Bacteroidota bacterium]